MLELRLFLYWDFDKDSDFSLAGSHKNFCIWYLVLMCDTIS